ncbi:antibiotic biosynthesis monooxygenase [Geodermatophilus sp. SYSU D00525]
MYARTTTIRGNPERVDAGITYTRNEVLPVIRHVDGFVGLSMLVDRDAGRCIVTSAWEDERAMRSSAAQVRPMRVQLVGVFGGEPEVREWQIAVLHRAHETHDGAWARLTWTRGDLAGIDRALEVYRSTTMPRIEQMPGFCSLSLLVDHDSDLAVGTVTFDDRDALEASREQARSLREESVRAMGREVVDVAEMELVLAHLRVPETV